MDTQELEKLYSLKEKGIITEEQFNPKKQEILRKKDYTNIKKASEELEKLAELKEKGILTEDEFNANRDEFLSQANFSVKEELDSNVEKIFKTTCKVLIALLLAFDIISIIAAFVSQDQDWCIASLLFFILAAYLLVWMFVASIPTTIAKNRKVAAAELNTITALSWLGTLFFISWIIAIILACIFKPTKWIDENAHNVKENDAYQSLEKLGKLKAKGLITEEEFNTEKMKLMGKI